MYVWADNGFAAETVALEEYKKGRWKTNKDGEKISPDDVKVGYWTPRDLLMVVEILRLIWWEKEGDDLSNWWTPFAAKRVP